VVRCALLFTYGDVKVNFVVLKVVVTLALLRSTSSPEGESSSETLKPYTGFCTLSPQLYHFLSLAPPIEPMRQ